MDITKHKNGEGENSLAISGTNAIKRGPGYNELTGTKATKSGSLDP